VAVSSSDEKSISSSVTLDDLCPTFREFVVVSSSQAAHISTLEDVIIRESQKSDTYHPVTRGYIPEELRP